MWQIWEKKREKVANLVTERERWWCHIWYRGEKKRHSNLELQCVILQYRTMTIRGVASMSHRVRLDWSIDGKYSIGLWYSVSYETERKRFSVIVRCVWEMACKDEAVGPPRGAEEREREREQLRHCRLLHYGGMDKVDWSSVLLMRRRERRIGYHIWYGMICETVGLCYDMIVR